MSIWSEQVAFFRQKRRQAQGRKSLCRAGDGSASFSFFPSSTIAFLVVFPISCLLAERSGQLIRFSFLCVFSFLFFGFWGKPWGRAGLVIFGGELALSCSFPSFIFISFWQEEKKDSSRERFFFSGFDLWEVTDWGNQSGGFLIVQQHRTDNDNNGWQ